jgi:flagellar export protein FliJ
MAGFHFPLEKVLRWRLVQLAAEEAKQKQLLQEQVKLQTLGAELGLEKSKLCASLATLPDLGGEDLRATAAYSVRLKHLAENIAQQTARCERNLAVQRKKYRDAQQRCRLLEELKSRRFAQWQYEQGRQLETLASESYLANWNRDRL